MLFWSFKFPIWIQMAGLVEFPIISFFVGFLTRSMRKRKNGRFFAILVILEKILTEFPIPFVSSIRDLKICIQMFFCYFGHFWKNLNLIWYIRDLKISSKWLSFFCYFGSYILYPFMIYKGGPFFCYFGHLNSLSGSKWLV